MSESGTIKIKMLEKGFGFIRCRDRQEYFFHRNALQGLNFEQIAEGDAVCFDLQPSKKKPGQQEAFNVRSAGAGQSRITTAARPQPATAARFQATAAANPPVTVDSYPPYHFVPVNVQHAATDTPVWHDGNGGGDLLSGELLCTLTARTPLLPGNDRYKIKETDRGRLAGWGFPDLPDDKSIVEPLRLEDGRVVIPGSALKGMLRHSLGALLSAPMERVGERRYTYRPNLGHADSAMRECRPAVVISVNGEDILVKVLSRPRSAVFLHGDAVGKFRTCQPGDKVKGIFPGFDLGQMVKDKRTNALVWKVDQNRLRDTSGRQVTLDHVFLLYKGGIDGMGRFANAFKEGARVHLEALVPRRDYENGVELPVSRDVYRQYMRTQAILADNGEGHLTGHPLTDKLHADTAKHIRLAQNFTKNQLVYVEAELTSGQPVRILSIGHHYQYRWAYTSSIRRKGGELRACLSPLAGEALEEKKPLKRPKLLSGSRLLFGYVHDEDNPIGAGVYRRLAGRIAINHALSESEPQFLGEESKGWCIPLPILGQPKPSAWEFYLQQKPGSRLPATYGDLPGDEGGDLAGRKFYLHQPRIKTAKDLGSSAVAETQATLARFICQPQTTFRFTLRFARLRHWELGALLAVLEPQRLAKDDAEYAHKVGLGRPLGMGSVSISIDKLRVRNESQTRLDEPSGLERPAVACLREKLDQVSLDRWLEIHRFVDRGRIGYPTQEVTAKTTIFNWHTDIRKEYSKLRREKKPNAKALLAKILPPKK